MPRQTPLRKTCFGIATACLILVLFEIVLRGAGWWLLQVQARERRTDGDLRVLCIGDSFTYGVGTLAPLFSWPAQLESILTELHPSLSVSVINTAIPGSSSTNMADALPEQLADYRPDVVCVLGGANNFWNGNGEDSVRSDPVSHVVDALDRTRVFRFFRILVGHVQSAGAIPTGIDSRQALVADVGAHHLAAKPWQEDKDAPEAKWGRARTRLEADLRNISDLSRAGGADLIIMNYPVIRGSGNFHAIQERVASEVGAVFFDTRIAFERVVDNDLPLIAHDHTHPNGAGYRIMASGIYSGLRSLLARRSHSVQLEPLPTIHPAPDYDQPLAKELMSTWSARGLAGDQRTNWSDVAFMLSDAGDTAAAIAVIRVYLESDPEHPPALDALISLGAEQLPSDEPAHQ